MKRNIRVLHELHIIHYDIKPENFLYSNKYEKPVFIDFGLSSVIKQELGELRETIFKGTFYYTCNEMK